VSVPAELPVGPSPTTPCLAAYHRDTSRMFLPLVQEIRVQPSKVSISCWADVLCGICLAFLYPLHSTRKPPPPLLNPLDATQYLGSSQGRPLLQCPDGHSWDRRGCAAAAHCQPAAAGHGAMHSGRVRTLLAQLSA
jgi:hypothetical protein